MMYSHVKEIFDEWDPIGVFPFAPKDEYQDEIKFVCKLLEKADSKEQLAKEIYEMCINRFGESVLGKNFESCVALAGKLFDLRKV